MSRNKLVRLLGQTSSEIILKAAALCDGHTIFKPEAFTDLGLPVEIVNHLTANYTSSDGDPKYTIYVKGIAVKQLKGVYGLDVLRFIASALNVEYEGKFGRGSQAHAIQQALYAHFRPKGGTQPA